MHTDTEILAARLARMRVLLDSLEHACDKSADNRNTFLKLKREMEAARTAIKSNERD